MVFSFLRPAGVRALEQKNMVGCHNNRICTTTSSDSCCEPIALLIFLLGNDSYLRKIQGVNRDYENLPSPFNCISVIPLIQSIGCVASLSLFV